MYKSTHSYTFQSQKAPIRILLTFFVFGSKVINLRKPNLHFILLPCSIGQKYLNFNPNLLHGTINTVKILW